MPELVLNGSGVFGFNELMKKGFFVNSSKLQIHEKAICYSWALAAGGNMDGHVIRKISQYGGYHAREH